MDLLQVALIFLILLLSIFLAITGIQVFFILKNLKKALDKLNKVLQTGENIAQDLEKPVEAASNLVTGGIGAGSKALSRVIRRNPKSQNSKNRRFYKKVL